jgi:hypothetical protein
MEQDLNQWYQLLTLGSWTCQHWHGEARTLFKKKVASNQWTAALFFFFQVP